MARLIDWPGLTSVVLVSRAHEIEDLIDHPGLDRSFEGGGRVLNRWFVSLLDRQMQHRGRGLDAFRPRDDAERMTRRSDLMARLDRLAESGEFPPAPVNEMGRYVVDGRGRRDAEAALAFVVAWPFLGESVPDDDAYQKVGRRLWRLHRRISRSRNPLSPVGIMSRLTGLDRRARSSILAATSGEDYGLHAVDVTLSNCRVVLEQMRAIVGERRGSGALSPRELAWAAIRTAPEVVVRQSGDKPISLPHVGRRVPPRTLVVLRMRRGMAGDSPSGYEFASRHWSACPAERYVRGMFSAVAEAAVAFSRGGTRG
jgi:hypothetical protein